MLQHENIHGLQPPHLIPRIQGLVWSCIDADLTKTAVFYAERYFHMDEKNHDARHLYATALFREGQTYSALHLVNRPPDDICSGCLEIKAKCCTALGRHRQAREALERTVADPRYTPSLATGSRSTQPFPDEAALHCRAGTMALKGNLPEEAVISFRRALALNPFLWEAFEGLCALGASPHIDELFPPRPQPTRRFPTEEPQQPKPIMPTTTGAGFFTPGAETSGNLFRWDVGQPPAFRMGAAPSRPRDSIATNESSFYPVDTPFQPIHRITRSQPVVPTQQPPMSRPLSSADETGPVAKKLRSTSRQPEAAVRASKSSKLTDDTLKKPTTSSRTSAAIGKSNQVAGHGGIPTRRSTRLLSGTSTKQGHSKTLSRDRRRQPAQQHARSVESEIDEETVNVEEVPSSSTWTAHDQATQETYESDAADHFIYDLMRRFAIAWRALSVYDVQGCIHELGQLPHGQQQSPGVLAMVGRANYERLDYPSAERAFKSVREKQPYRLWDMEVYSTLLWHLQRNVELSFLAQELLSINPQCSQAWIAVGNLFSLQRERTQALTCFRRALQMDPTCAYAYTLSGHESIDEDVNKAVGFFQSALRADPRHYNAWYGLGTCYLRMSRIRLAEYHFRKASEIHPNNVVLLGCVGLAVERRGDREGALAIFDQAIHLCPENALVRYRRAKILIAAKKYHAAAEDLESLRKVAPEEANVIYQLAKVYRLMGNELKSAQMLALARDISPKSMHKISKLLDTLRDEGDQMDEG
ncbi:anaphase-promoting complex subunit cdc27 [Pleurotus ostreatus]|nr:anaphase-promoting complex subunit cdc27 [Pleurotus ostreatus]